MDACSWLFVIFFATLHLNDNYCTCHAFFYEHVKIGGSVLHGPVYEAKLVSSEAATSDVK